MITAGKSYWTVNAYDLSRPERTELRERLKAAGLYAQTQARNTKPQAEALVARIEAELGVRMTVNETSDLAL